MIMKLPELSQRLDNKIQWILETYLKDRIDEFNTNLDSDFQIDYPQNYFVGINAMNLESSGANIVGTFPAITVYQNGSSNIVDDIVNSQTEQFTFSVVAGVMSDAGGRSYASKQAKYLAQLAAETLEKYLPDAPGIDSQCSSFRVDIISSAQSAPIHIGNSMYIVFFETRLIVYSRYQISYNPAYLSDNLNTEIRPYETNRFEPDSLTTFMLDETGIQAPLSLGATDPGTQKISNIPSVFYDERDSFGVAVSNSGVDSWLTGSDTFMIQNQSKALSITGSFLTSSLPDTTYVYGTISDLSYESGDLIVFTFIQTSQTNRLVSYGLTVNRI